MKKLLFILLFLPLFAYPQPEKRHRSIIVDSLKALNGGIVDAKDTVNFEKPLKADTLKFTDAQTGLKTLAELLTGTPGDSSFVTLQWDTAKAFNNTNLQFTDSTIFQEHLQTDKSFTVNKGLSLLKGIDATTGNFAIDVRDNTGVTRMFNVRNDNKTIVGGSAPVFSSPLTVEGANGISLFRDATTGGVTTHYHLKNSASTIFRYAAASGNVRTNTAGSENGFISLFGAINGVLTEGLRVNGNSFAANTGSVLIGDVINLAASGPAVIKAGNSNDGNLIVLSLQNQQANTASSTNESVSINATFGGVNDVGFLLFGKIADFTSNPNRSTFMSITTMDANVVTEKMRIDNKGNMGINETSPSEKLHVNGNAIVDSSFSTTARTLTLGVVATTFAVTSNVMTITGDAGANTVATITGANSGQYLILIFVDGFVTLTDDNGHGANTLDLSAAFTSSDDTTIHLIFDGTSWYEISKSTN